MTTERPPQDPARADYTQALKEADEHVRARRAPSPHAKARIKRELLARRHPTAKPAPPRAKLALGFGALAIACALAVAGWWALAPDATPLTQDRAVVGLSSASTRCLDTPTQAQAALKIPSRCQLTWEAASAQITTFSDTTLNLAQPETLELRGGEVTIKVTPRPARRGTVRVKVSGGVIEVLGTTFTIQEDGQRGQVALHEGKIRFTHTDGQRVILMPGQSLSWPAQLAIAPDQPTPPPKQEQEAEPEQTQAPEPPPEAPPKGLATSVTKPKPIQPKRAPDAKALAQIAQWRRAGDYERALDALLALEGPDLDARSAEIISYEIGDILTHQLKRAPLACARWRKHLRAHRRGTYARAAREAQRALECDK